jgi:hypothetical protein
MERFEILKKYLDNIKSYTEEHSAHAEQRKTKGCSILAQGEGKFKSPPG